MCFVSIHEVHPYSSMDTATAWKKSCFILSDRSDFHLIDNQSIAFHAFIRHMITSLSVDEMSLPRYGNWSTNFRGLALKVKMASSCLKHKQFYLCSCRGQCLLLIAPGYVIWIQFGLLYLQSFCGITSASSFFFFQCETHFLLFDLLMFKVHSLGRLLTNIVLMYLFARPRQQYWS